MPAAPSPVSRSAEPACYMLPGVRLFASGRYRGKDWTPRYVRQMAASGRALGPSGARLHVPPAAPGHEDDDGWQSFVGRTDEPAAGWVDPDSLRAEPDPKHPGHLILRGDVVNVPPEMAAKIRSGEYRYGSAEIYDDFRDDFDRSFGKVVRKFSYLGAEVPQVKRLGPLPAPVPMAAPRRFSERAAGRRVILRERVVRQGQTIHTYAETAVMDRQQMTAALMAAMPGLSQATLDALTDDQLADLVKNVPTAGAPAAAPAQAPAAPAAFAEGDDADADADADAGPSRDEMIAELVELGQDQAELEGLPDDELAALYEELTAAPDADPADQPAEQFDDAAAPAAGAAAAGPTREEMIAELAAAGQDPAALEGMSDADLAALYAQLAGAAPAAAPAAAPVAAMGERRRRATPTRTGAAAMSEKIRANAKRLNDGLERELRRLTVANHRRKVADATAFCEQLVRDGRATPALVKATLLTTLLSQDDTQPVHTFTENGRTVRVSAYEKKKRELGLLPKVVHFGERFPKGGPAATTDEGEAAKVRDWAGTLPEAALRAWGKAGPEQVVHEFAELRKKKPGLTARQFIGV